MRGRGWRFQNRDFGLRLNVSCLVIASGTVEIRLITANGSVAKTEGWRFDTLERCPSPRLNHSNGATIPAT